MFRSNISSSSMYKIGTYFPFSDVLGSSYTNISYTENIYSMFVENIMAKITTLHLTRVFTT